MFPGMKWAAAGIGCFAAAGGLWAEDANRLTYLDAGSPFQVGRHFPKLTTPQWVGEPGVDAVVTLGIDDMSSSARYEQFLRPILERLQRIDGRAPVSIFCNAVTPDDPQLAAWLREGVSLEVHTLSHPCPLLSKRDFAGAEKSFHGGVDLLNHVPGNLPVAFRTPCCDSINSPSPRVFAELLARTNPAGQFLRMDSSVVMLMTTNDPALPASLVTDADGRGKFTKYVPFPSFVTTVENYPYPWVIGNSIWEFPCMAPSDWEAQNILGNTNATMLADWQSGLEAVVLKQGTFNFVFHPHGWSANRQLVEFIDGAVSRYGRRVKFLNYREAHQRLSQNLSAGQPLRAADGSDNGVRLLDLDEDGFLDVVIGNAALRRTRRWHPASTNWVESGFPVALVEPGLAGVVETGVRFGVVHADGRTTLMVRDEQRSGAWTYTGQEWVAEPDLFNGLELDGQPVFTRREGLDQGVRFRDVDGDGRCELLVSNERQNAVFQWNASARRWQATGTALPPGGAIVNARGEDNGVRFVDVNEDGHDDVLISNEERYALWLYVAEPFLGWGRGWTRKVTEGVRANVMGASGRAGPTPAEEIPPIVRAGPYRNNGAWIHSRHLWVQNEDTAELPNLVDRRSFDDLMRGAATLPKSPAEALTSFRVRAGFHVELVVSEPLVQDPVAFDWDAQGRLWVVEMRDYPNGVDGAGKPGGVIKILEDLDGDGRYDRATEFLREVNFPNGVLPWRGGILVSAAPEIFFAEDTDGNGRAEVRRTLFEGFVPGNQQHRANGFNLGLDGWIYGANGDSGGEIRSVITGKAVSIQGRDFRFRPDTGEFEAIEGQTQFGRQRDDWGRWFGNANYTWLWHYPLASRYLQRNPYLAIRDVRRMLAQYEDAGRVYPASRALPRPNVVGVENTVTSACSPTPYRDTLFGPDFANSVFVSEPSENLIHREVVEERGAGLLSHRAEGERTSEFLASTDNWFRPVQTKTGPDGALYLADMYRQYIEHPEWIPKDVQGRIDVRAGQDRGRIYRVVPDGKTLRPIPKLQGLKSAALVEAMDSPNGWQRDTVMRLLWERGDRLVIPALQRLVQGALEPNVRLQALATLDGLGGVDPGVLRGALADVHPGVVIQAVRISEAILRQEMPGGPVTTQVMALSADSSPAVVLQVALSLGESVDPAVSARLADMARRFSAEPLLLDAVFSSVARRLGPLLDALDQEETPPPAPVLERCLKLAVAQGDPAVLSRAVQATLKLDSTRDASTQFQAVAGLLDALERQAASAGESIPWPRFAAVMARAEAVALAADADESLRIGALQVLGRVPGFAPPSAERLAALLVPQNSGRLQQAALAALQRQPGEVVPKLLIDAWSGLSPAMRGPAIEVLLSRGAWVARLLDAVEQGTLPAGSLGATARQRLRDHADPSVVARARKVLGTVGADRQTVIATYGGVRLGAGDAERGRQVFQAQCTSCHRLQGEGHEVGPDLGAVTDKSVEALLVAILDPNRAVEERYLGYRAQTRQGHEITGIIVSESPGSLTLRGPNGVEDVLLRSDLASLQSTGRSLMPDGFEHAIDEAAMADLLVYVTASGPRPKTFDGNRPEVVRRDSSGAWKLTAAVAEIYGDSLVYEPGHGNLGYWQSSNDQAIWTLDLPRGGEFDLWLDWAAPEGALGNRLQVEVGPARLPWTIQPTGTWEQYRQIRIGRMRLEEGRQRLVVRGLMPLRGAILDLRQLRLLPAGTTTPADFGQAVADPTGNIDDAPRK